MNVEAEMIISLLKLTRDGPVSHELINKDVKVLSVAVGKLLQKLQNEGLIYVRGRFIEANDMQRVKLAIFSVQLGADFERVSSFLQWKEFEGIAATAFEKNGYGVTRNLRFSHCGRRYEIDVVGCKKPLVVCIDCKHWHYGLQPSTMKRIVQEQLERTAALTKSLPSPLIRIGCASWGTAKFVPAVLSLLVGKSRFHDNVPVVPVLQLQDFLNQLPANVDSLKHFQKSSFSLKMEP